MSGVTMVATLVRSRRPRALPSRASRRLSSSVRRRRRLPSWRLRIWFSAIGGEAKCARGFVAESECRRALLEFRQEHLADPLHDQDVLGAADGVVVDRPMLTQELVFAV